jgi:uncharacterized membrane-anchored protein
METRIARVSAQLHPVTGDVRIDAADAVLHLGEDYYFLPADQARLVLTEGWGNPPEAATNVLGMVFPQGRTFADDTWGAVITYEDSGYVSDDDAASTDYDELLRQLQSNEPQINEENRRAGFPEQHLVGWAQVPAYDGRTHSVVWAKNIRFEGSPENTLNYDIRLLGRRGVLSMNMVTSMSKLEETRAAAQRITAQAEFVPGARYADFQAGSDRVAEFGVASLIAAGVGATVAKKAGLLALILGFGKKIIVFLLIGLGVAWRWIKRLFGSGGHEEEGYVPDYGDATASAAETAPATMAADPEPDESPPQPAG